MVAVRLFSASSLVRPLFIRGSGGCLGLGLVKFILTITNGEWVLSPLTKARRAYHQRESGVPTFNRGGEGTSPVGTTSPCFEEDAGTQSWKNTKGELSSDVPSGIVAGIRWCMTRIGLGRLCFQAPAPAPAQFQLKLSSSSSKLKLKLRWSECVPRFSCHYLFTSN